MNIFVVHDLFYFFHFIFFFSLAAKFTSIGGKFSVSMHSIRFPALNCGDMVSVTLDSSSQTREWAINSDYGIYFCVVSG